jgi:hypothetical protein
MAGRHLAISHDMRGRKNGGPHRVPAGVEVNLAQVHSAALS